MAVPSKQRQIWLSLPKLGAQCIRPLVAVSGRQAEADILALYFVFSIDVCRFLILDILITDDENSDMRQIIVGARLGSTG